MNFGNDNTDVIDLEVAGTAMSFEVNGTDETIEGAQFTSITVNALGDADNIDVDQVLSGKSVTMLALMGFDLRAALKEITVPTLVLSGSRDNNAPAPMMEKMATYIPGSVYVELEGVGHLANLERPDEFNAVLWDFLMESHEISGPES